MQREGKKMARDLDEEEERRNRNGRLIEGEDIARKVVGSAGSRGPAFYLRTQSRLTCRRVARASAAPRFSARIAARLPGQARRINLAPFHLEHDFVSRERTGWTLPAGCRRGRKVAVFPATDRDVDRVKKVGTYNQDCRVWTVKAGHKFLSTPKGRALQSDLAAAAREIWLAGKGAAHSRQSAVGYQAYIERIELDEKARSTEIEADNNGPISIGNIGDSLADRLRFWKRVADFESRHDSRLQSRIIFELPHWVTDGERRTIVERFGQIFADRGLGYWVVVHRPGQHGDRRNFHGHIAYHDRPVIGHAVDFAPDPDGRIKVVRGDPLFASKKDRSAQGGLWVEFLRREFAHIVNDVLIDNAERTKRMPPRFYFPGSYSDLGIEIEPQQHLGPRETALLRKGTATKGAAENLGKLEAGIAAREETAIRSIRESIAGQRARFEDMTELGEDRSATLREFERVAAEASNIARLLSDLQKLQTAPNMHQANRKLAELLEESAVAEIGLPNGPDECATDVVATPRIQSPRPSSRTTAQRIALIAIACLCLLHRLEARAAHLDALQSGGQSRLAAAIDHPVADLQGLRFVDRLSVARSVERTALLFGAVRDPAGQWFVPDGVDLRNHRRLLELFGGFDADIASRAEAAFVAEQADRRMPVEQTVELARSNNLPRPSDDRHAPPKTTVGTATPTDDQIPLTVPAIPPAPFVVPSQPAAGPTEPAPKPEDPKPARPQKPDVRYVHEVCRKWVLDIIEAQFRDITWIERLRGRPLIERVRNRLLLRISDIPTYSIQFHSPDGWRIEQIDETIEGSVLDPNNRTGTFQSSPILWARVLKASLNQVALCLDPEDVRRHIADANLEAPKIRKGFYRFVDGSAELCVRQDAGQFQMLGHSERLEPLFQSLIAARTELWKQHVDIGYRPIANLVHKSLHELGWAEQLQHLPSNRKSKRMLADFDFCKTWAPTCNPTRRPKQELTTAEEAARRKTNWVHIKLVAPVVKLPPPQPPAPVVIPPFFTPELVFELKKEIQRLVDGHALPTWSAVARSSEETSTNGPDSPTSAPVSKVRQLWSWITGRTPKFDASPSAAAHAPSASGADLPMSADSGRSAEGAGSSISPETCDWAESERRRMLERLAYQTKGVVGRNPSNPNLKHALEFMFMGLNPINDKRLKNEIESLPWQTLRKIRNELREFSRHHWDPQHEFEKIHEIYLCRSLNHVCDAVAAQLRHTYRLRFEAPTRPSHVRDDRVRSREDRSR